MVSPPSQTRVPLPADFYHRPADAVARDLLGRWLQVDTPGSKATLRLVETEAYLGRVDRASHAWNGRRTPRTESLYLPPGHLYVYLIYGLHHCANIVTAGEPGSAVLLRAAEVLEGAAAISSRRGLERPPRPGDLAGGPGKLCQGLGVDKKHDGAPLGRSVRGATIQLLHGTPAPDSEVAIGPRVGIDNAGDAVYWPLRFAVRGHRGISKPQL